MVGIKAFVFKGKKAAKKALNSLEDSFEYVWLDDVAVISVSKHGHVRVHSTWAQDDDQVEGGIGYGALTGGLIGALFGPEGALLGALGGSATGGLIGTTTAVTLEDPNLSELAAKMQNDTSALVLVAAEPTLAEFATTMEGFDVEVIDTELNEADLKKIQDSLKG